MSLDAADVGLSPLLVQHLSGALVWRVGPVTAAINNLGFSQDGEKLAAALALSGDGVRLWTAPFDDPPHYDTAYGDSSCRLDFAPGGSLATTSDDGFVRLYDHHARLIKKKTMPAGKGLRTVAL